MFRRNAYTPSPRSRSSPARPGRAFKGRRWGVSPYDLIFGGHDLAVSLADWPGETAAIYAYEDGALLTFRKAARLGLQRVWDLPLPHYQTIASDPG